nr:AEC family transporter [Mesorhizobium sp. YR577]
MGFPIALYALGKDALIPTTIAAIITMCVIFAVTIIIVEIGLQTERHPRHLIIKVGKSLIKNPLLVAPALGALFPLTGVAVPATVETYLKLMGGAASPCALVVLGLFLTGREKAPAPTRGATAFLVSCKLLLQPLLAFLLATFVFQLSPLFTNAAVLLAALPTGTGSYMLAEYHHRDVSTTSRTIIVSTLLSIITISVYVGTVH